MTCETLSEVTPGTAVTGAKGRVLLADDEVHMRAGCAGVLRARGYEVETAADGRAAIELLSQHDFDVVVSDISMPGTDGLQLLRAVRERDLDLPVVMMTGSPEIETAVKAIEHGAMRYLIKPFRLSELEAAVEHALRMHRLARLRRQALAELGVAGIQVGDLAGLEASFARGLATLWMAYQPIVRHQDHAVYGYEALVRCAEPTLPHPGALFAAAERLGRLHDLGRAIRGHAAATASQTPEGVDFFVNLHARELSDAQLYDATAPLSRVAGRVVLEITERASVAEIDDMRARIAELRRMGFRIAIDDLGAGYAGLTSFVQLEPDVVKLDMALVRDAHLEPIKRKLIYSITALCKEMGVLVVAEGIESPIERDTVVALGCDLLQGYHIARPGPAFPTVVAAP